MNIAELSAEGHEGACSRVNLKVVGNCVETKSREPLRLKGTRNCDIEEQRARLMFSSSTIHPSSLDWGNHNLGFSLHKHPLG